MQIKLSQHTTKEWYQHHKQYIIMFRKSAISLVMTNLEV
jgi:hypothetical protein